MKNLYFFALLLWTTCASADPITDLPVYAGWAFSNAQEAQFTDAEKVQLILDNSYDGFMGCRIVDPEKVKSFGVTLPGIYFKVAPESETFEEALARLQTQLPLLSKQEGAVWLFFKRPVSTPLDEARAIAMLRDFSAWSEETGYHVDLYSHRENDETKFHWPHSEKALEWMEKAEVDNLGIVFTVYHERFNGFEKKVIERFDAAAPKVRTVALYGPEMIKRNEGDDPFYDNLLNHLERKKFRGSFLIYSRPYKIHASEYLAQQKAAFESFRKQATKL